MLKSELVISGDIKLLESHIKHYSIRFLSPIFSDESVPDLEGYKKERARMIAAIDSNPSIARGWLIPQMISERDLFARMKDIIMRNKEFSIDLMIINNIIKQMEVLKEVIERCCVASRLTRELINYYYEESLVLLIYFSAARSYITTIRNMRDIFKLNDSACVLTFSHLAETSLSVIQQKNIIIFIEKILTCFFADYLDIITVEFDTGSPRLDCSIKVNHESKETWDKTRFFSDFFNYLFKGDIAGSMRAHKKISNLLNQDQKRELNFIKSMKNELTQEEYEKLLLESFGSFSELRRNNIAVAVDNSRYNQIEMAEIETYKSLEGTTPLQIEDISPPLLPDKT
jgi:hypothetical protein